MDVVAACKAFQVASETELIRNSAIAVPVVWGAPNYFGAL